MKFGKPAWANQAYYDHMDQSSAPMAASSTSAQSSLVPTYEESNHLLTSGNQPTNGFSSTPTATVA